MTETAIAQMPRGGPDASWLDRLLGTDMLEYTDRYDVDDKVKQRVITMLDRMGTRTHAHEHHARTALSTVAGVATPRILGIGAGHGRLSEQIVALHDGADVTVSDLDPTSVANIAAGDLGAHPRVRTQVVDATAIDAPDGSYDLVVFAQAFHHLPPNAAQRAIAEATRVGTRFLVIDLPRHHPTAFLAAAVLLAPAGVVAAATPALRPIVHDGFISGLRAYSRSALITLGKAVDPKMDVQFLKKRAPLRAPSSTNVVFRRPNSNTDADL